MTFKPVDGIVAVMLTPFRENGSVDYDSLAKLTEWYIANQVDVLFAVCQSSEMFLLTLEERVALSRFVVAQAAGRVRVVSSGHISERREDQFRELAAMAETRPDGLILLTNLLDPANAGEAAFLGNVDWLMGRLPRDMPLGLYECPAPYRRLLSEHELAHCAQSGRFVTLKDVSCNLARVGQRLRIVEGTPLSLVNANGTIALEVMQAGGKGYSGVFTNIHPDLYAWMYRHWRSHPDLAEQLSEFLVLSSVSELMGYPAMAKLYLRKLGVIATMKCRSIDYDYQTQFWWGGEPILDKLMAATERYRRLLASAT
jgi:4-hydroxy-tetrahydrodipicolinate synthase